MNRQKILIAASVLASVSIGANVWLLMRKKEEPRPAVAAEKRAPDVQLGTEIDFNGTGLQDGVWKLDDDGAGKKVPVFEESGLTNDSWKLGDGKEKGQETGPSVGPPRSTAPPVPAPAPAPVPAPQSKSVSAGPGGRELSSPSTFVEEAWNPGSSKPLAVDWDKPFDFEDFAQREQQAMEASMPPKDMEHYFQNRRAPFEVTRGGIAATAGDRLKDTAGTVPLFERRFLGGASNLRGFEFRETSSGPVNGVPLFERRSR